MGTHLLEINSLTAKPSEPGSAEILGGIDLSVGNGELHAVMGPNGAGKSTLANVLAGSSEYQITGGDIFLNGKSITDDDVTERAIAGLFLAFQHPHEIQGVSVLNFLRQALSARSGIEMSVLELRLAVMEWTEKLGISEEFLNRHLNEGFSGGERKRNEILQMAVLKPKLAILDETDSGLDIDALRTVATGIGKIRSDLPEMGTLVITHYEKLLEYLAPDYVHVLINGKIVASGDMDLVTKIEENGYDAFR